MVDKIRWGILSTARINKAIISQIRNASRSELVAVASRNVKKAKKYALERNISKSYGNYKDLLKASDVDVVYLPLPNSLHYKWAVEALNCGKHVLCEKPLVTKLADLDSIKRKSEKEGLVIFEAFMYLHHKQTLRLKELLNEKEIGDVQLINCWYHYYLSSEDKGINRLNPLLDGGCLWDIGVYPNSLSVFLADIGPPLEVWSISKMGITGVDLSLFGQMKFTNGIVSQISVSFCSPSYVGARILGNKGYITINEPWKPGIGKNKSIIKIYNDKNEEKVVKFPQHNPYLSEIEAMESCILDGANPVISLNLSRDFLKSLMALKKSATRRSFIKLKDN